MVFQITACFITDIDFDYIAPDPTGEELTNFFEQVAKKNCLEFDGVTFGEEDTVLTLSTCCRSTMSTIPATSGSSSWRSCCRRVL